MRTSYFKIEFSKTASPAAHQATFEKAAMLAEKTGTSFYGRADDQSRSATLACDQLSQTFDFVRINGVLSVKAFKPTY